MRAVARLVHRHPLHVGSDCHPHRSAFEYLQLRGGSSWNCLETPNPKVRKFEPMISGEIGMITGLPAALPVIRSQLLLIEGVRDVFVAGGNVAAATVPWLSVTRTDGTAWETLTPQVQALLEALPDSSTSSSQMQNKSELESQAAAPLSGIEADIEECLDGRIRPSVQADGGDVELVRWDPSRGDVYLRLKGACRGCPQSAVTLKETILRTLTHFVPDVRAVVAEEEPTEETSDDPFADITLEHDGEPAADLISQLAEVGTPFFSTFAGMRVQGKMLKRVKFLSRLELQGRTPEHVIVNCSSCRQKRAIEDPADILRREKGNSTGNAAMVICPACCVFITP